MPNKNAEKHYFMLIRNNFALFFILLISLNCFTACLSDKDKNIPDVSDVEVTIKVNRFDQDLFAIDTNQVAAGIETLEKKYPDFTDFYLTRALQIKKPWDTTGAYREYTKGFLTYPFVRDLHHKVDSVYGDFSSVEQALKQGFKFYKHYFPNKEVPEFYTFISEFTYGIAIPPKGNAIAIGLDLYLGKDFEYYYYPPLSLPKYVARTNDKPHLPAKIFKGIVDDLVGPVRGNRFIDHIINNGKKMYVLDHILPYAPDSIKLGYTAKQVEWVNAFELDVWGYMLKEELMYSDDYKNYKSLVTPAPKSAGLTDDSPGEVGNWMGWQIVQAYMRKTPEATMQDLLALEDVQEILTKSKYKPRRR
ncbi:MAG: hypothetical protein AB8G86_10710 [Saprospiraceae bacterium]